MGTPNVNFAWDTASPDFRMQYVLIFGLDATGQLWADPSRLLAPVFTLAKDSFHQRRVNVSWSIFTGYAMSLIPEIAILLGLGLLVSVFMQEENCMSSLSEHQSKAGKGRMKQLNKAQRKELARKAGLASAAARKVAKNEKAVLSQREGSV
jgi:hypothetical protein